MFSSDKKTTALVFIRVVLGVLMFIHGAARIGNGSVDDLGQFLTSQGFPLGFYLAWAVTLFEVVASILFAAGLYIWITALLLIIHLIFGIVLVHWKEGWFVVGPGQNGIEYNVLLIASFLTVAYANYKGRR